MTQVRKDNISPTFWANFISPMVSHLKNNKCEECGSKSFLDIHHTDYDNVNINTLKLLCRSCHKKEHRTSERNNNRELDGKFKSYTNKEED